MVLKNEPLFDLCLLKKPRKWMDMCVCVTACPFFFCLSTPNQRGNQKAQLEESPCAPDPRECPFRFTKRFAFRRCPTLGGSRRPWEPRVLKNPMRELQASFASGRTTLICKHRAPNSPRALTARVPELGLESLLGFGCRHFGGK